MSNTPVERYQKANIRRWVVQVNRKTQPDILQHLESIENVQGYILNLIRSDMERANDQQMTSK